MIPFELVILAGSLGLRHGFDYDHLAAIGSIAFSQRHWQRSMILGTLYALGHATTIFVLTAPIFLFHVHLPGMPDHLADRLVGVTLIAMASYMLININKPHGQTRGALMISAVWWIKWRFSSVYKQGESIPEEFLVRYNRRTVFGIGIVHGIGAETPTQLGLFLLTASASGPRMAMTGLVSFLIGLMAMNTCMTASATGLLSRAFLHPKFNRVVSIGTAVYSLTTGVLFVSGRSGWLPALGR